MKTFFVQNRHSGSSGEIDAILDAIEKGPGTHALAVTEGPGHAEELARGAVREGFEVVVAAGGDGTVSEVARGIASADFGAALGILPLGTGNDLARSLGIPRDPAEALRILRRGRVARIDVVRAEFDAEAAPRLCVNVAAGGFSGQVDELLTEEMKARWGPFAYLAGAAKALPDLTGYATAIAFDDGELEFVPALAVLVANGRTCAGGLRVAEEALLDDGLVDVVMVERGSLLDVATLGAMLVSGSYLGHRDVHVRRASRVRIASKPGMWFNVDGELVSKEPVTFTVVPRALRVVVGDAPALAASG